MKNKKLFSRIIKRNIKQDEINYLASWLCKSDFYTTPALYSPHSHYEGLLLQHSINVYRRLVKLYTYEYGAEKANEDIERLKDTLSLLIAWENTVGKKWEERHKYKKIY